MKFSPLTLVAFALLTSGEVMAQSMSDGGAELDCLVRPEKTIELSSPVDTTLKALLVQPADEIELGQPLVQLENSMEIAKLALAEKRAASWTEVKNREVQLQYAKRNLQRIEDLYKQNSVPQFEKDKADTEVSLAEIELIEARENRSQAQLNLQQARTELALRTIKSPINGIVVDVYAQPGESVAERTIMKLAQIDPLRVELIAPTEYFGLIEKGMEVEIQPERPADRVFRAEVTIVDQLIDPASGSFTVRMALPNPGDELIGGVNCLARFNFPAPPLASRSVFSQQ